MTSVFLFTESRFSLAVVVLVYKVDIDHQLVDNSYSVDGTYTDMHMCECIYVHIIYTYKGGINIFKKHIYFVWQFSIFWKTHGQFLFIYLFQKDKTKAQRH